MNTYSDEWAVVEQAIEDFEAYLSSNPVNSLTNEGEPIPSPRRVLPFLIDQATYDRFIRSRKNKVATSIETSSDLLNKIIDLQIDSGILTKEDTWI